MDSSGDIDYTAPQLAGDTLNVKDRMTKSKSVFGVDTIWEKEMAKLKIIQEQEAEAAALRAAKEALEAKAKAKKKAKKLSTQKAPWELQLDDGDMSAMEMEQAEEPAYKAYDAYVVSPVNRMPILPPQLAYSPDKAIHMPVPDDAPRVRAETQGAIDAWSDSDDDAPKARDKTKGKTKAKPVVSDSDSEEDVPLSKLAKPNVHAARKMESGSESDSEEDVPLSKFRSPSVPVSLAPLALPGENIGAGSLGLHTQGTVPSLTQGVIVHQSKNDEDDDDVPLMLRKNPAAVEAEDDLPLGYKHADAVQRQHAEAWRASMASPPIPAVA